MKKTAITRTKSPLTSSPLRNPGQSLDEQIQSLLDDKVLSYLLAPAFALVLTIMEWTRWRLNLPYSPVAFTIFSLVVVPFSVIRLVKLKKQLNHLKQGRDGEKAVGQYLELLREKGCRIFHDILGDGYNIDHVIVSEYGVFAVETKTFSKPSKGEAKIEHVGNKLIINGVPNTEIIIQAKAEASSLMNIIEESTGRKVGVKAVAVFPGWFIDSKQSSGDVWVLNPKALPAFIQNTPKILSREDVMLISYHISRHIRQI